MMAIDQRLLAGALCATAALLGGCSSAETGKDDVYATDLSRPEVMTLEELAQKTLIAGTTDRYLVEGDMAFDYEGLTLYYEKRYTTEKSIVTTVVNKTTGATFDAIRPSPRDIRYCLTSGWGGAEATQASVQTAMDEATAIWAGTAHVRFRHVSTSDGAACTQAAVPVTVDLVVKPNVGKPNSSYAWWYYAQVSEMAIGKNMTYRSAMLHELGHVLGLDHEQFHDSSGLGCAAPGYTGPAGNFNWGNQRELTSYDNKSIMGYYSGGAASCGGGTPNDIVLTTLDGVGVRSLYGNPEWWPAYY